MKDKKGFTLIELLAVIAILAVIILVAVPNVLKVFNKSIEEIMTIEEKQASDAGTVYVRDNCGRTAISKQKKDGCRSTVAKNTLDNNEVYFCLNTIKNGGYIDEIKYKGNTRCDGIVVYDYNDDEVIFSNARTYLICENSLYKTQGFEKYEDEIKGCTNIIINEPETSDPLIETYTITYYNIEGAINNNPTSYNKNQRVGLNDAIKSGYTFEGWYKENTFSTKITFISKGTTGNISLYAKWNKNTITCDAGSYLSSDSCLPCPDGYTSDIGSSSIDSCYIDVPKGNELAQNTSDINPCKEGYINPLDKRVYFGDKVVCTPCSIGSYQNEQGQVECKKCNAGFVQAKLGQTSCIPCPENTYQDEEGKMACKGCAEGYHSNVGSLSCSANTYIVSYNANGGTGSVVSSEHKYDEEKKLTKNRFTKIGYTFTGWSTSLNGTKQYDDESNVKNLTKTNGDTYPLFAVWSPDVYKVTLNNNGATTLGTTEIFEKYNTGWYSDYNSKTFISKIDVPEKPSFIFGGYYTEENGKGLQVIDSNGSIINGQTTIFTNDNTLHAKWSENGSCEGITPTYLGTIKVIEKSLNSSISTKQIKIDDEVNNVHVSYGASGDTLFYGKAVTPDIGVTVDGNIGAGHGPDYYVVYSRKSDIYYSTSKTSDINQMSLLSNLYLSTYEVSKTYYIYKSNCVKHPQNYTFVGEFHTGAKGGISGPKILVYDKDKDESSILSNGSNLYNGKDYSNFGIVGAETDVSIYARKFGLYYSGSQTDNVKDLKKFSAIQWSPYENKRYWIYKINTVKEPSDYELITEVFTASTKGVGGPKVMILSNNNASLVNSAHNYTNFSLKYYFQSDEGIWYIEPKKKTLYYYTTETTNQSKLKKFSSTLKGTKISSKFCIYKKK